jgi:hypothetical protein
MLVMYYEVMKEFGHPVEGAGGIVVFASSISVSTLDIFVTVGVGG